MIRADSPERAALRTAIAKGLPAFTPKPASVLDVRHLPAWRVGRPVDETFSPLTASDKLERLVDKSLDRLNDVLDMDPSDYCEEESQLGMVRAHISAAEKILNTQVRVDQNRLRKRQDDTLSDMLQQLRDRETRLPQVPLLDVTPE